MGPAWTGRCWWKGASEVPGEPHPWLVPVQGRSFVGPGEAVLGADTARLTGLKVGDVFQSSHGFIAKGKAHNHPYRVVGILAPVHGPYDKAILVPLEDIWEAHAGHGDASFHTGQKGGRDGHPDSSQRLWGSHAAPERLAAEKRQPVPAAVPGPEPDCPVRDGGPKSAVLDDDFFGPFGSRCPGDPAGPVLGRHFPDGRMGPAPGSGGQPPEDPGPAASGTVPAAPCGQHPGVAPGLWREPSGSGGDQPAGGSGNEPYSPVAGFPGSPASFGSWYPGGSLPPLAAPEKRHRSVSVRGYAIIEKNTVEEF